MSQPHSAQHRQSEGEFYAETQRKLQEGTKNLSPEDQREAREGVAAQTQKAASDYSVAQGEQLLKGQTTRSDAPTPNENYSSKTHQELYDMLHNGLNIEDMNSRSTVTNAFGNFLADASDQFTQAANASGGAWQGAAADKANGFFQKTASHTEQTGNAVQLTSNRYSQQSAAAHYAKTHMPEPVNFDQNTEMDKATKQIASGDLIGGMATNNAIAEKQQQAKASHQQAVDIITGLDTTYRATATTQPTYAPPPLPGESNDSTHASGVSGFTGGHTGGPGTPPGGSGWTPPPGGQPGTGSVPPPAPGGGGSYLPPGSSTSTGSPSLPGGGLRGPAGGFTSGPRFGADGLSIAGANAGAGGSGGDITRSRPAPGTSGGRGSAGARVSGGGYTPGKSGAEGEPGAGKGSGSGSGKAGERLERGATAANAKAGAAGKSGAPGAGAGAGGKKKEDDKEHTNKTPFSVDPDEVFEVRPETGPDGEKVTPPVIGA